MFSELTVSPKYDKNVFELRNELFEFYEKGNEIYFKNDLTSIHFFFEAGLPIESFWLSSSLNHMKKFFNGPNSNVADFLSRLQAYFLPKLPLWQQILRPSSNTCSITFCCFIITTTKIYSTVFQQIYCHLKLLKTELMHYFLNIDRSLVFQACSLWNCPSMYWNRRTRQNHWHLVWWGSENKVKRILIFFSAG